MKATVPALAQQGMMIVGTMYRNMLRENPQFKPLFDQANQASGEQKTLASQQIYRWMERYGLKE